MTRFGTPWSTDVQPAEDGKLIRVSLLLSVDPGPMKEFRPFLDFDLDESHATQLLGGLVMALREARKLQERRVAPPVIDHA